METALLVVDSFVAAAAVGASIVALVIAKRDRQAADRRSVREYERSGYRELRDLVLAIRLDLHEIAESHPHHTFFDDDARVRRLVEFEEWIVGRALDDDLQAALSDAEEYYHQTRFMARDWPGASVGHDMLSAFEERQNRSAQKGIDGTSAALARIAQLERAL